MERKPSAAETSQIPVEDVLGEFKEICDGLKPPLPEKERIHVRHLLHAKIEKLENHTMVELYENGKIPTFESMGKAAQMMRECLLEENDLEAQEIAKLLTVREKEIRSWSRRYVGTLIQFRMAKSRWSLLPDEEAKDRYQKADIERRRVHDNLLDSLKQLNILIQQGVDYGDYPAPAQWKSGSKIPEGYSSMHPFIFSLEAIRDRDFIRDWAIIADQEAEIERITGEPKEKKTE